MSFVEPLFLIGLLAACLPLLIHLINRRKATPQVFPAMRLLHESNKRTARATKVRQRLLLLARVLIVAFLAMALAKPFFLSDAGLSSSDRLPTAVVFVVDTSASMQHGDWWERARETIEEEVGRLRTWDEVAWIDASAPSSGSDRMESDHTRLREALAKLAPGPRTANLSLALTRADELLATSQLPNRRVILLSDFSQGALELESRVVSNPVELRYVRSTPTQTPDNVSVTGVTYTQEGSPQEHMWRLDAEVKNWGPNALRDVRLELVIDGVSVASGQIPEVQAKSSTTYSFRHRFNGAGSYAASVSLQGADAFPADDTHHFSFRMRDRVRTLLVNGEPASIAYEDELFFLTRALNPKQRTDAGIIPTTMTLEGLDSTNLERFDAVFLVNVPRVPTGVASRLEAFVRNGGGVFVILGDQVDPKAYNQSLEALLPRPLRSLKELARRGDPDAPVKITRLGATQHQHPIFRAFNLDGGATLQSVGVYSYMLLEPGSPEDTSILLSYKDNAPALLERKVGKGRVLMLTTSADFEWTDLPIRAAYLPLMQRASMYLARRAASRAEKLPLVGEPLRFEVEGLVQDRLIVQAPGLEPGTIERAVYEPLEGVVTFTPSRPGFHALWADEDGEGKERNRLADLSTSVNIDPRESDLAPVSADALQAWIGEDKVSSGSGGAKGAKRRVNLWPPLLFLITLILLAETVLGTRRSVLLRLFGALRGDSSGQA